MRISEVHDYDDTPHQALAKEFIEQGRKESIKNEIARLVDDEFDQLELYAAEHISAVAASRAEKFLKRVLNGDEDAAMSLLGDERGVSRRRTNRHDAGEPWPSLIHGSLFETDGIRLRRKVVEANADLIRDERIADLEATVEGLENQVRKLEREREELRSRL